MGVRRLLSKGGKKFPGGGQEHTFCLKTTKNIHFFSKSLKTYYFWPGFGRPGGKSPPFPPPDAHDTNSKIGHSKLIIKCRWNWHLIDGSGKFLARKSKFVRPFWKRWLAEGKHLDLMHPTGPHGRWEKVTVIRFWSKSFGRNFFM